MSGLTTPLPFERDIRTALATLRPVGLMMEGDAKAHTIRIVVTDGGKPAALEGYTASGYMIRADGVKVPVKAQASGNVVTAKLNDHCYAVPGPYAMYVRASNVDTGEKVTLLRLAGMIEGEGDGPLLDSEHTIPSIDDLLAQIERMEEGTEAAKTAAENAIAQTAAAKTATQAADAAARKIDGLTVSSHESEALSVEVSEKNGAKHIDFGLRRGEPGYGMKILGIYASISSLRANRPNPSQGDMYMIGEAPPYEVYMFNSVGASAGWTYVGSAIGAGVATVAGVHPDANGNVALNAQNVGARPDDWTPTAEDVGARPDDWTPSANDVGAATFTLLRI